jgi:hypothetical protein
LNPTQDLIWPRFRSGEIFQPELLRTSRLMKPKSTRGHIHDVATFYAEKRILTNEIS